MEAEKWGRRIRAFRKLKGYTQESFAKEMGVSVSILGEIERGNRMPTEEFLSYVSEILQISLKDLTPPEESE
ncbi:helix-turn-helix domain-containing protein [Cytobacillus spongiae]|jgi:transcriptional regulator with XRE-family HTH domain|uniref:helix-turn-helix domain-containing protein n=1 Tax=Cytobacillus spongiae TaxID=2901381 RepID=UPI001F2F69F0|nr:helix-turn-helix transcriptional regulator [Cytobacillus spongiae]UII56039.1 helix-turn-helix domain-containing protein [Cytobacillus spongiae]